MGDKTGIQWTQATWNPLTGCTKISQGCKNCYAEVMAKRLQAMGQKSGVPNYRNGFQLTLQPQMLDQPLRWKRPRLIFVNSMSDLFHKDVPLEYIQQVFDVMTRASWHTFQILTKRADRLAELAPHLNWPPNVWMGVSVEDEAAMARIAHLRTVPAAVRFLSCEPLIGPLPGIDLAGIHWVIAGGESGRNARPMHTQWVRDLRDSCRAAGVPFFFKQHGEWMPRERGVGEFSTLATHNCDRLVDLKGLPHCTWDAAGPGAIPMSKVGKSKAGRELDGRTWDEMPHTVES